jgi:manganese transport protein
MAIGLQLLFGLPLIYGVCITVLDTFLLLFLLNFGIRRMEAFIITLVATIGASFFLEMIFAKPDAHAILSGFVPSILGDNALYIAIGIIGATVMPHNLYLHSALVQTRRFEHTTSGIKKAIRFNLIDSTIALNLAFFVNSAILILAATAFFNNGLYEVAGIQDAHRFLQPLLGTRWAPILFAVALIAAGQSSTITGTLAGQIVMEGYLNLRIQPWVRRIITRLLAIVPALLVIYFMGEAATGRMLIFSQVILSVQLGFAVIPLVHLVSDKKKMGEFAIKKAIKLLAWSCAILIVLLNMVLIIDQLTLWLNANGSSHVLASTILIAAAILAIVLLCYIFLAPFIKVKKHLENQSLHMEPATLSPSKQVRFKKIAVAVDFSATDIDSIRHALSMGAKNCEYCLVHVVETVGARIMGSEIKDMETQSDLVHLQNYVDQIARQGYSVTYQLGYGSPKKAIPNIVNAYRADLLILGAHGHTTWKDMLLGTTIEAVRHRVQAPVMIVQRAS